jgi:6-phosphogluconolactonase
VTDVVALALDPTGALRLLNRQPCGRTPCHCVVDASGRWLLSSTFSGGDVIVHPIRPDGSLGPATQHQSQLAAIGQPPDDEAVLRAGASRSAAHQVALSPRNDLALVSDLRLDSVLAYRFDAVAGRLEASGWYEGELHVGCRHLVFAASGRFAYGINQGRLSHAAGSLSAYEVTAASSGDAAPLRLMARLPTLPDGVAVEPPSTGSAIALSRDGRFLYCSNRGHDSVAIFGIEPGSGMPALVGHVLARGSTPRDMKIDPSGRFLAVGNQGSDEVTVFAIDGASGRLQPTGGRSAARGVGTLCFINVPKSVL